MADPQKQTFTDVQPIQQAQSFTDVTPIDGAAQSLQLSNPSTVPNARIRNMTVDPTKDVHSAGQAFYEGAKIGALASSPLSLPGATIPGLIRGAIGATAGGYGGKTLAKAAGAGEFGQEVAGDVGGALGGGLAVGAPGTRVGKSIAAIARPATTVVEDLPVIGSVIKGAKAVKNVSGELADIWRKSPEQPDPSLMSPSRTMPGQISPEIIQTPRPSPPPPRGPLYLPEQTPSTIDQALNSPVRSFWGESTAIDRPQPAAPIPQRSGLALPAAPVGAELADLPTPRAIPAAQSGEALGTAQPGQAGQLAASMKKQPTEVAPGFNRGALGDLLNKSLGAEESKVQPGKPIYQRSAGPPSGAISGADLPEGHTAHDSSALRSSKYDPAAQEFHARYSSGDNTVHVFGDVTPEEADAFNQAGSKGKAMQQIKNGHPLVAKIINGKRQPMTASQ